MDVDEAILIPVWKAAIHSGWLIPATFPSICEVFSVNSSRKNKMDFFPFSGSCKIDAHLTSAIIQKESILQNLKQIPQEMGNLFKAHHNSFLAGFARWFHEEYDDRYIPLHLLFNPHSKCMEYLKTQLSNSNSDSTSTNSFHPVRDIILSMIQDEFIDLSKVIKHRELENQSELSVLYRLGGDHQIILDHAFTGGPLSLIGRFTADPDIYEYGKSRIQQVFTKKDILYADFELLENDSSHRVSIHQNLLPFKIIYHHNPNSSNEIPLSDIWIGIDEGKIILYHPTLQKRIMPVLQHCLNKNFISHPICRLIYEIACQDQLQLALHLSDLPPFVSRVPRITWKNIIISPAIWILHLPASIEILSQELKEKAMPRYLLAGEGDQELLIDTHGKGLNILFNLLEKQSQIKVSECNWIHNPVYSNQKGAPIFPQFLVNLSIIKSTPSPTPSFRFNPRKAPDRTWIGVRIYLSKLDVKNFLVDILQPFLSGFPKAQQPARWFYMAYVDSKFHLRIRFKVNEKTKSEFEKELHYFLALVPEISHHRAELYYPEYAKYSHESIQLSEMLFHLESNMLVNGYKGMNLHRRPLLRMDELAKMNFAIHFGFQLFYTFKISRIWYEAYKVIVASYSGEERGKFKAFSEGNFIQGADIESLNVFKKQYFQVLKEHAFLLDDQMKINLLQNHFHMMINRFFPDAGFEVEPYIMYCIFRKTAKLIYAPKSGIAAK